MVAMSTDILESIRDLRRSLSRAATAAFADTGVGPKQVQLLRELRRGGNVSQVELSRATLTEPAGLMRALDALERRGWTRRESCDDDRRRKLVSLTPAGKRAVSQLDGSYEALRSVANGALSPKERLQFCALAARISAALHEAGAGVPVEE
jgi:MarR family transcriptional regulator for hemolysin